MKKYIACLLAAILLLTMLPASASAEGGMQACHRVTAKYTDSKQSNKSGIRLWSVKTALTSVDDEINGLAQAYADKIAPTLQAGKATGDKNSRLDIEIRHSKTGLTWMSFLVQARTTYHRPDCAGVHQPHVRHDDRRKNPADGHFPRRQRGLDDAAREAQSPNQLLFPG